MSLIYIGLKTVYLSTSGAANITYIRKHALINQYFNLVSSL